MEVDNHYRIEHLKVTNLWGTKDFDLRFNPSVNILIGPNASGKTTLLNLLYHTFSGNFDHLSEIEFEELQIRLRSFNQDSIRTVLVSTLHGGLEVKIARKLYTIPEASIPDRRPAHRRRHADDEGLQAAEHLQALVPAVWLPVTRRLPISEKDDEELRHRHFRSWRREMDRPESVDEKLSELLEGLNRYRHQLDSRLTIKYKEFEKNVLQLVLYNKERDSEPRIGPFPTDEDKRHLVAAFEEAGLLDAQMGQRINEHFAAAHEASERLMTEEPLLEDWADISVIPLIWRTKKMVDHAQQLDEERDHLFAPLHRYENLVNSFLIEKQISVGSGGELIISLKSDPGTTLQPKQLSSGEKQVLILLTQALLKENEPVVYVADEPELSLHVTWQEKLLPALQELGKEIQLIVATHSPDIVGNFVDNVIQLDRPQ